jgi:predicted RNA-binding Zn-ribbon protein involved in translation (DUF1610 family)
MLLVDKSETSRHCPDCGSDQICRVSRSGAIDRIRSLMNRYPYECFQCPTGRVFHLVGKK